VFCTCVQRKQVDENYFKRSKIAPGHELPQVHKVMGQSGSAVMFHAVSQNAKVKELLKSLYVCQSYHKKRLHGFFFDSQCTQKHWFITRMLCL